MPRRERMTSAAFHFGYDVEKEGQPGTGGGSAKAFELCVCWMPYVAFLLVDASFAIASVSVLCADYNDEDFRLSRLKTCLAVKSCGALAYRAARCWQFAVDFRASKKASRLLRRKEALIYVERKGRTGIKRSRSCSVSSLAASSYSSSTVTGSPARDDRNRCNVDFLSVAYLVFEVVATFALVFAVVSYGSSRSPSSLHRPSSSDAKGDGRDNNVNTTTAASLTASVFDPRSSCRSLTVLSVLAAAIVAVKYAAYCLAAYEADAVTTTAND